MKSKKLIYTSLTLLLIIALIPLTYKNIHKKEQVQKTKKITATVLSTKKGKLTVQDTKNIIYTFNVEDNNKEIDVGSNILLNYTGLLDKNTQDQKAKVTNYDSITVSNDEDGIPISWLDNGIFSDFYILAKNKIESMTLDEKIGQLFLVRYPDNNAIEDLKKYNFAGYIFFEKDFKDKTKTEVQNMINNLQQASKIPILTAVDEEGGKVVRVSSNPNLAPSKFKSPQELYNLGGFNLIKQDTIDKSKILNELGLNLNLAPVVDVSTDSNDYIYERTLGQDSEQTSIYAETVIEASKGTNVSYTLKHFPGYGNNKDTHNAITTDNRSYESIMKNDIPPFKAGIDKNAEAVLVSHNITTNIDKTNPASLSPSIHNILRNELDFTGIIMTDDLSMGAISNIDNATVKALLAGNDLIITTDYKESIEQVKNALSDGTINEELINKLAFRVIAWKYYKGLMFEIHK